MKYIQQLERSTTTLARDISYALFTRSDASAAEILIKAAVAPILLWACGVSLIEWLA